MNNRGLDNSGKTTIVKAILKEDVKEVSPTLGFNIKTVQRDEYVKIKKGEYNTIESIFSNLLPINFTGSH